jgi:hypothetical protein
MLHYNIWRGDIFAWPGAGAFVGMKWVRANIKHGSRLALLALAIQFALAFGHFHGVGVQTAAAKTGIEAAAEVGGIVPDQDRSAHSAADPVRSQPASPSDSDQQTTDACAICAVMALANAALFASPPLLLLPQAVEFLYLTTDAEFVHLNSARIAFQPRAPPAS